MKKKKRLILLLIAALLCINTMGITAFAMEMPEVTTVSDQTMHPMTEETEWYYRYYNGVYQKRLWSITYGYWKTDWIDCVV